MIRTLAAGAALLALAPSVQAQSMGFMAGMKMGGMTAAPVPQSDQPASAPPAPGATVPAPGVAPPPPAPTDHYADRDFPAAEMAASRARMMREEGGRTFHQILFNLAEVQVRDGHTGYRWNGEGWFGGDIDRLVVKSEGAGAFGEHIDAAEIQALYSHAIGPYFDLQAGVRHDFAPAPTRTYATIGVEGLAPYMVRVEARGFVATTGQVLGRLESWYDQRLTQRLVLQPRVELNLAAQDDPATRTGRGLVDAQLGLRLRYEVVREFAPYVGISYEGETGRTATYTHADGKSAQTTNVVAGVRFWF